MTKEKLLLFACLCCFPFSSCLYRAERVDGDNSMEKIGFRPYYLGDLRVFGNEETSDSTTKKWIKKVLAEDSLLLNDTVKIVFKIVDSTAESYSKYGDTLKNGYTFYFSEIGGPYCDMYAWYPDSGSWGVGKTARFSLGKRDYNIKVEKCQRFNYGGPSQSGGREVTTYVDSVLGIVFKFGVYSSPIVPGECHWYSCSNELKLLSLNLEIIDPDLVRSIADSIFLEIK